MPLRVAVSGFGPVSPRQLFSPVWKVFDSIQSLEIVESSAGLAYANTPAHGVVARTKA